MQVEEVRQGHQPLTPAIRQVVAAHLHRHRSPAGDSPQVGGIPPPPSRRPVLHAACHTVVVRRLREWRYVFGKKTRCAASAHYASARASSACCEGGVNNKLLHHCRHLGARPALCQLRPFLAVPHNGSHYHRKACHIEVFGSVGCCLVHDLPVRSTGQPSNGDVMYCEKNRSSEGTCSFATAVPLPAKEPGGGTICRMAASGGTGPARPQTSIDDKSCS